MRSFLLILGLGFRLSAQISVSGRVDDRFRAADHCRGTVDFVSKPANEGMTDSAGKLIRLDYFFNVAVDFCYKGTPDPDHAGTPPGHVRVGLLRQDQSGGELNIKGAYFLLFLAWRPGFYVPVTNADSVVAFWNAPATDSSGKKGLIQLQWDAYGAIGGINASRSRDAIEFLGDFRDLDPEIGVRLQRRTTAADRESRVELLVVQVLSTRGQQRRDAWKELSGAIAISGAPLPTPQSVGWTLTQGNSLADLEWLEEIATTRSRTLSSE